MTIETDFLNCPIEKLTELCGRIETCLGKLTADQVAAAIILQGFLDRRRATTDQENPEVC